MPIWCKVAAFKALARKTKSCYGLVWWNYLPPLPYQILSRRNRLDSIVTRSGNKPATFVTRGQHLSTCLKQPFLSPVIGTHARFLDVLAMQVRTILAVELNLQQKNIYVYIYR